MPKLRLALIHKPNAHDVKSDGVEPRLTREVHERKLAVAVLLAIGHGKLRRHVGVLLPDDAKLDFHHHEPSVLLPDYVNFPKATAPVPLQHLHAHGFEVERRKLFPKATQLLVSALIQGLPKDKVLAAKDDLPHVVVHGRNAHHSGNSHHSSLIGSGSQVYQSRFARNAPSVADIAPHGGAGRVTQGAPSIGSARIVLIFDC